MNDRNDEKLAAFEDMGQIEVDFLGQRIVIGCIEGEEEKALRLAKRFETDAGECMKAVSTEISPIQAMLMAGILTYEDLEELENNASDDRT